MLSVQTPLKSNYNPNKHLIIIVGPTAIGKTTLSIELAQHYRCPIVSFDSRQFYKEMSIGTAKPTPEELAAAEHLFIDSHSINQDYTSGKFELDAITELDNVFKHHDICIAVGGSGLYIDALVYGIDSMPSDLNIRNKWIDIRKNEGLKPLIQFLEENNPEVFEFIDRKNHARMIRAIEVIEVSGQKFTSFRKNRHKKRNFTPLWIGLDMPREKLYERINHRVDLMIQAGLEEEVKSLQEYQDHSALRTVGYAEFFKFFNEEISIEDCIELIKRNSRRYAKRQFTWFKKNTDIHWFSKDKQSEILPFVKKTAPKGE